MMAPPPWIGWSKSKSVASRSPRLQRPASGTTTASTSLIRQATLTSRLKLNVRCAFSMARSLASTALPALSHSPKPYGVRPISTAFHACASSTSSTVPARTSNIAFNRSSIVWAQSQPFCTFQSVWKRILRVSSTSSTTVRSSGKTNRLVRTSSTKTSLLTWLTKLRSIAATSSSLLLSKTMLPWKHILKAMSLTLQR